MASRKGERRGLPGLVEAYMRIRVLRTGEVCRGCCHDVEHLRLLLQLPAFPGVLAADRAKDGHPHNPLADLGRRTDGPGLVLDRPERPKANLAIL